jgi:hypothetical protein
VTYSRPQDSPDAETRVHKALLCARSVVVCTLARIGAIRLANVPDPALLLSHTPAWRIQPAIHPRGSFVSATETI